MGNVARYVVWTVVHLGLWAFILVAAAGIGRILLTRLRFNSLIERIVFTLAVGLGTAAFILFLLGVVRLAYRGVLIGITIAWGLISVINFAREINIPRIRDFLSRLTSRPFRAVIMLVLFITVVGGWVCIMSGALYPPTAWDATDEHLLVAREFLAAHRPVALPGIVLPVLPALNHTLFAWGMALKDDILAQLIEHTLLLLTAFGLYSWGCRQKSSWFGLALAAFWIGNPMILWLGQIAYVDLCLVCFAFLGVYALRVFWIKRDRPWWYLAMTLFGMAAGAKLPGLFFVALGMITGLIVFAKSHWDLKRRRNAERAVNKTQHESIKLRTMVAGWAVGLIALAPWYGFIAFHTGNPLWPAFTRFSRGVWGSPILVEAMSRLVRFAPEPRTLHSFLWLPLNWLIRPYSFYAPFHPPLNPLVLLWPLAWLVAISNREVRWWTIWGLSCSPRPRR